MKCAHFTCHACLPPTSDQKLKEENEMLRQALEDIREWAKHNDVIRFDDGDMPLSDFCARALHGGK
jgi:hypothetical protein